MIKIPAPVNPLFKLNGGKRRLLKYLQPHFPSSCHHYFEPFVGAGAVFFSLDRHKFSLAYLGDVNEEFLNLYSVIQDPFMLESLENELDFMTGHPEQEVLFHQLRTDKGDYVHRAARIIYLSKMGFNGLYRENSKGVYNVPFGKRQTCPVLYDTDNLALASSALYGAQLCHCGFELTIAMAGKDDLVYCDPPYWPASKTANFTKYSKNDFTLEDQIALRDCCVAAKRRGATVLVSNSYSEVILDLYRDCDIITIDRMQSVGSRAETRGVVREVLIKV
jgi:DNA adenine methylase